MGNYRIFDTLLDAVFIFGSDKKLLYFNTMFAEYCGTSPKRIKLGTPCYELMRFDDPTLYCMDGDGAFGKAEQSPYKELTYTAGRGKTGRVQLTIQPFETGEAPTWIAYLRDVSLETALQEKYRSELEKKEKALLALEDYSKNLEAMVEARTVELKSAHGTISAIMNSLGQGFMVFDSQGIVDKTYSKACETLLECMPAGKTIWEVLKTPPEKLDELKRWISTAFAELLPVEDLLGLGPKTYPHSLGKHIAIEYQPMRSENGKLRGIVAIATDRTSEVQARVAVEKEKAHAKMILNLIHSKTRFMAFVRQVREGVRILNEKLRAERIDPSTVSELARMIHTIKGDAASFSILSIQEAAHVLEQKLNELKKSPLELWHTQLPGLSRELVELERAYVKFLEVNKEIFGRQILRVERFVEIPAQKLTEFQARLPVGLREDFRQKFLLQPIGEYFTHYSNAMINLAEKQDKELQPIEFVGGQLPILPDRFEELFSSLVHVFRNAVAHGIETKGDRAACGKGSKGKIEVRFSIGGREDDPQLAIEISDDGRGIDPEAIRAKLVAQGIQPESNDQEVIQHIFDQGLSTQDKVDQVSGMGIGLAAVKETVQNLGGSIEVSSRKGRGTRFVVKVPVGDAAGHPLKQAS